MKLTNYKITQYITNLSPFMYMQLPTKLSFAVVKTYQNIKKDFDFFNEQHRKILINYAELDEDGKVKKKDDKVIVKDGCGELLNKEFTDLMNIEVNVNIHPIKEDDLYYEDTSGRFSVLTPSQVITLSNLLCTNENTEEKEVPEN